MAGKYVWEKRLVRIYWVNKLTLISNIISDMVFRWQKNDVACARYRTLLIRKIYYIVRYVYPSVSSG